MTPATVTASATTTATATNGLLRHATPLENANSNRDRIGPFPVGLAIRALPPSGTSQMSAILRWKP
jgi:hypothetical protein